MSLSAMVISPATGIAHAADTDPLAPFYSQRITWHSCQGSLKCGTVRVPIDYREPSRGSFHLAVSKAAATGKRQGFLLTNPGGPGATGLDFASSAQSYLPSDLADRYDVIGFDTRGVGESAPVTCMSGRQTTRWLRTDTTPDTKAEVRAYMRLSAQIGAGCLEHTPMRARHVSSYSTVRDMDIIRAALGTPTLDFLGYSYGTFLGARYAQDFPTRVGRFLLDGAVDPRLDAMQTSAQQNAGFQYAIGSFAEDCTTKSSCPYPGDRQTVLDGINGLLAALDHSPMPTSSGEQLTQSQALSAIFMSLYSSDFWPELRTALRQATRNDGTGLLRLADFSADRTGRYTYGSNVNSAFYAIGCWDLPAPPGAAGLAKAAHRWSRGALVPEMSAAMAWGNAPCSQWFGHSAIQPGPIRTTTTAPVLIIGTTHDPATPLAAAKALSSQMPTSGLLTFEGVGHTAFGNPSPCIDQYVSAYFLTGALPPAGTICR